MHILITGGCGYTGTVLTNSLIKLGHKVTVVDIQWFGNYLRPKKNLKIIKLDVRNSNQIPLKNVDAVISPHPELKELAFNYNCSNIFDIKNIINYKKFSFTKKIRKYQKNEQYDLDDISNKKMIVSFIARFDDWKDPITFIEAIPKVIEARQGAHFLIVGEGCLENAVKAKIEELNLASYVSLLGSRKDIDYILSITDIFVALSTLENIWSVILVEAVAMKVPCILTKAGKTDKYFSQYKDAVLIPIKNSNALSNAIIKLIDEKTLRATIADNAYNLLKSHGFLSADKVANDTINVYNLYELHYSYKYSEHSLTYSLN